MEQAASKTGLCAWRSGGIRKEKRKKEKEKKEKKRKENRKKIGKYFWKMSKNSRN